MGARSGSHDAQSLPAASWTAKGYPRLAQLMGGYADVAIFRRFGTLNCLNILSLQAEILDLEDRLKDRIETDDRSSDAAVRELAEDFYALRKSDGEQKRLLKLIRPKLKEYSAFVGFSFGFVEYLLTPARRRCIAAFCHRKTRSSKKLRSPDSTRLAAWGERGQPIPEGLGDRYLGWQVSEGLPYHQEQFN